MICSSVAGVRMLIRSIILKNSYIMNLQYLTEVIIPQREKELFEGKNLCTAQPIYVVLDLIEGIIEGHSDYTNCINHKGVNMEYGFADASLDAEDMKFLPSEVGMKRPKPFTRYFYDRFKAFFLTSKAAHEYLKYQEHNLTNPYVYVFYSGYGNKEMDQLLQGK
jgi:hypothetical protein